MVEKRAFKRYSVPDFVVAVFDNRLGRVVNISKSGMAVQLTGLDFHSLPKECETSLLSKSKGFLIEDIPLTVVRKDIASFCSLSHSRLHTIGVKFNTSNSPRHLSKLLPFIWELL